MTQESEGSKRQWPPVGKSSEHPEGGETQDGKDYRPVIREARGYGAGCVYNHHSYPVIMITIQLDDQDDIMMLALMVQQLIHECGCCNCEDE